MAAGALPMVGSLACTFGSWTECVPMVKQQSWLRRQLSSSRIRCVCRYGTFDVHIVPSLIPSELIFSLPPNIAWELVELLRHVCEPR